MAFFLPETRNPELTTQTTGLYTVPAGKFAFATCEATETSDVTINAVTVLSSTGDATISSFLDAANSIENFTFTRDGVVSISFELIAAAATTARVFIVKGADSIEIDSVTNASSTDFVGAFNVGEGDIIRAESTSGSATAKVIISGHYIDAKKPQSGSYWLTAGDAISGGNKHIAQYSVPPQ